MLAPSGQRPTRLCLCPCTLMRLGECNGFSPEEFITEAKAYDDIQNLKHSDNLKVVRLGVTANSTSTLCAWWNTLQTQR